MLLAGDAISESPLSALPEGGAVVPGTAFDQVLFCRNGRHPELQVYIEGLPDVICTAIPPDAKSKTSSVVLNGSSDYLSTNSVTDLAPDGDLTVVVWFKVTGLATGANQTLFSWVDDPVTKGWEIYITNTTGAIVVVSKTTSQTFASVTTGVWYCLVVSQGGRYGIETRFLLIAFDASGNVTSTTRTFTSGSGGSTGPTRATRNSDSATLTAAVQFGRRNTGTYFYGKIGFASIFTRALGPSEMERIVYRILDAKWVGFWSDLRAQWRTDEGTGNRLRNTSSLASTSTYDLGILGATWDTSDSPWTITYRPLMSAISASSQDLEARATRTTISGVSFSLLDTAEWMTAYLKRSAQAVRRKSAYIFMGFDEINEEDYRLVMNGAVESVDPMKQRGYEVRIGDAIRFTKTSIALGKTRLASAITNVSTTIPVDSLYGFAAVTNAEGITGTGVYCYIRIDNEIIGVDSIQASPPAFVLAAGTSLRGLYTSTTTATAAASHASGASVQEIIIIENANVTDVLLQLLISSTGELTTDPLYDTRAKYTANDGSSTDGRGAGLSLADIDVDNINAVNTAYFSTYYGDFLITDTIDDLKSWLEENILRPLGAFFYVKSDGRLTIGTWNTPSSAGVDTIAQGDQSQPDPAVDFSRIINSILVRYDYDPIAGTYGNAVAYEDLDSGRDHGPSPTLRIDSPWIRTKTLGSGSAYTPSPATITAALKTLLFARFKNPQAIVSTTAGLGWIDQDLSSGVKYQHEEMPDLVQGFRGLQGELMQIVSRTLDPKRARMNFKVMRTP